MEWVISLMEYNVIEEVHAEVLEEMIAREDRLAVIFYEDDWSYQQDLDRNIQREVKNGWPLVKVKGRMVAQEYGIDQLPTLILFTQGILSDLMSNTEYGSIHTV